MARNFLDGVSEVCNSNDSVYLISEPFRGNELAEVACDSAAKKGVVSLGLFSSESFSLVVKDDMRNRMNKWDMLSNQIKEDDMSLVEDHIEWKDRKDLQRNRISKSIFENDAHCVPLGDEPRKAIKISCYLTNYEQTYAEKHRGVTSISSGLANACSHRLVFSSEKRKNEFKKAFISRFPTGNIAAGSNKSELYSMIRCLRDGRPLFVLRGTGIVSCAAEMFINRCNDPTSNLEQLGNQLDNFIPITADIIPEAKSLLATVRSSLPHYNPDTFACFDIDRDVDLDQMKTRISEVIGTVFDFYPEVGGEEKDSDVLKYCEDLLDQVRSAKWRYRINATMLQFLMRGMIITSISFAIIHAMQPSFQTGDSPDDLDSIEYAALITALIGAGLHAFDAYARPNLKFATLLLTEARLESETFRFKTRTGEYRLLEDDGTLRDIRVLFTKNCQRIFDECVQSDFAHGSLKQWPFSSNSSRGKSEELMASPRASPKTSPHKSKKGKKKKRRNHEILEIDEEVALRETPESSYDLGGSGSNHTHSGRELRHVDSAASSKSTLSFHTSMNQMSAIQRISYGEKYLSFDNYVSNRLMPTLIESENSLPLFTFFRNILHIIVIGLTASCSLLIVFEKIQWVPLILAIAATAEFFLHFFHLGTRVPVLNASTRELRKVKTWEQGLTQIQTRLPSKKNELVDRCEIAILSRCEHLAFSNLTT